MSAWLYPWWIIANAALGHVVWRWWRRHRARRKAHSHDALMLRIARLELAVGVGLDWAEKWLRERPVMRETSMSQRCWGCNGSIYTGFWGDRHRGHPYDPELEARLCRKCIEKAHAEMEAL